MQLQKPLVILGTTASGKSALAESLAQELNATLLAVDSMQVYRGMNIGTAKPDAATRQKIPHLMIDIADPWESYSAARFVSEATPHLQNPGRGKPLILIAGTFLYLRSLIEGLFEGPSANEQLRSELTTRAATNGPQSLHAELTTIDPLAASRIHPNDQRRIIRALEVYTLTGTPISTLQTQWSANHPPADVTYLGIRWEKDALSRRINARVKKMIDDGLINEVDQLRQHPKGFSEEAAAAVGYRQLLDYFAGKIKKDDAIEEIKIQTRYLAKSQRTWLKRWPPASEVTWLDASDTTDLATLVQQAKAVLHAKT